MLNSQSTKELALKLNNISVYPELGMIYGSKKEDIDLFFLFKGIPVQKNIVYNQFDLIQIEFNDFQFRLGNLDIEFTEPILTGEYLFGDKNILEGARNFLELKKPSKENFDYMNKRALETYLQAKMVYTQGKNNLFSMNQGDNFKDLTLKLLDKKDFEFYCPITLKSLSLLTYPLSYLASKQRYLEGENKVTFKEILENPTTKYDKKLVELRKYYKSKETSNMKISEVNQYFEDTKNLLIKEVIN